MAKKIFCKKLNKELTALSMPPMPGPKGLEIMNSISEEAWDYGLGCDCLHFKITGLYAMPS